MHARIHDALIIMLNTLLTASSRLSFSWANFNNLSSTRQNEIEVKIHFLLQYIRLWFPVYWPPLANDPYLTGLPKVPSIRSRMWATSGVTSRPRGEGFVFDLGSGTSLAVTNTKPYSCNAIQIYSHTPILSEANTIHNATNVSIFIKRS